MYGRRRLTRVEIAVYAVIVGTLAVVFFSYLADYMEMAEKTAMQTTLSNVTTAINLRYASLLMQGQPAGAERWQGANPFELADAFPPGYRGLLGDQDRRALDRPVWLFDAARAELVYMPRLHAHLSGGSEDELRFRLERHPSGFGFVLAPTSPYEWNPLGVAKDS